MIKKFYALFEHELADFGPIFEAKNDKTAVVQIKRFFDEAVKKDRYFTPGDYSLIHMFDMIITEQGDGTSTVSDFDLKKVNVKVPFCYDDKE